MVAYNYTNHTLFSIENDALRYSWAAWYLFVALCSLLGDTTILVAAIKYNAFNMSSLVVTFIKQISVTDLIFSMVCILPVIVSVIKGGVIFGISFHYVRVYISYYCYAAQTLLICGMTTYKVLLLKYPLRVRRWSKKQVYKICAVIWTIALFNPIAFFIVDKDDVYFDYRIYTHNYGFSSGTWDLLVPISSIIGLLIPNIITIGATVILINKALRIVRKDRRSNLRWQGIITVVFAAVVYNLSILPLTVYSILQPFVKWDPVNPGPFHTHFYRIAVTFLTFNIMGNFFIYSLTVSGFREFLKSCIIGHIRRLRLGSSTLEMPVTRQRRSCSQTVSKECPV